MTAAELTALIEKLRLPTNTANPELERFHRDLLKIIGGLLDNAGGTVLYAATLASDLNSGATVTLGGKTYDGAAIRSGYKLASGTTIYGAYDGTNYKIVTADACEVPQ